jgi:phosphate acetyltransferase
MGFSDIVWERARGIQAHIVLPESTDARMLHAAARVMELGLARKITLVGNPAEIRRLAEKEGADLSRVEIVDHLGEGNLEDFADSFYDLRKAKGLSREEALSSMKNPLYYGAMMVRKGLAEGMVAGAVNSSANLLRAAFTVVGLTPGNKTASSCFVMILPDRAFGREGQMIFADCATVPSPDAHQLADIAIASAETGKSLLGLDPVIAMLSFSTKGSATHESLDKVVHAVDIVRKRRPDIVIDGELQADAAVVEAVAQTKCPGSPVKGMANILIFPDLNAGNIAYKLVQRLAKAEAFGPILQGLAKPVNDLSRGCSTDDIVNVTTITAVQTSL